MKRRHLNIPNNIAQLPFILASVSRRWRNIALACSAVWSFLYVNFGSNGIPIAILELALKRSKSYPLTLIIQSDPTEMHSTPTVSLFCRYFETLLSVSGRWQYFFLSEWPLTNHSENQETTEFPLTAMPPYHWALLPSFNLKAPQLKGASIAAYILQSEAPQSGSPLLTMLEVLIRTVGSSAHIESLHFVVEASGGPAIDWVSSLINVKNSVASPESSRPSHIHLRNVLLTGADVACALKLLKTAPSLEDASFFFNDDDEVPLDFSGWRSQYNPTYSQAAIVAPSLRSLRLSTFIQEEGHSRSSATLLSSISAPSLGELAIKCETGGGPIEQDQLRDAISSFFLRSRCPLMYLSLDHQSPLSYPDHAWYPSAILDHPLPIIDQPECWQMLTTLHLEEVSVWTFFKILPYCVQLEDLQLGLITEPGAARASHGHSAVPSITLLALKTLSVRSGDTDRPTSGPPCWTRIPELLDSITAPALENIGIVYSCARHKHAEQWPLGQWFSFLERSQCRIRDLDLQGGLTSSIVLLVLPHPAIAPTLFKLRLDFLSHAWHLPIEVSILNSIYEEMSLLISFLRADFSPSQAGVPLNRLPSLRSLSFNYIHESFTEDAMNMVNYRLDFMDLRDGLVQVVHPAKDDKDRYDSATTWRLGEHDGF